MATDEVREEDGRLGGEKSPEDVAEEGEDGEIYPARLDGLNGRRGLHGAAGGVRDPFMWATRFWSTIILASEGRRRSTREREGARNYRGMKAEDDETGGPFICSLIEELLDIGKPVCSSVKETLMAAFTLSSLLFECNIVKATWD